MPPVLVETFLALFKSWYCCHQHSPSVICVAADRLCNLLPSVSSCHTTCSQLDGGFLLGWHTVYVIYVIISVFYPNKLLPYDFWILVCLLGAGSGQLPGEAWQHRWRELPSGVRVQRGWGGGCRPIAAQPGGPTKTARIRPARLRQGKWPRPSGRLDSGMMSKV